MPVPDPANSFRRSKPDVAVYVLLLGLCLGTVIGSREFAHVGLTMIAIPLYVTEGFLAIWLVTLPLRRLNMRWAVPRPLVAALLLYLATGFLMVLRSLVRGDDPASVLRDFAVFYYGAFLLVGLDLLSEEWRREILALLFVVAALPILVIGQLNLSTDTNVEITTSGTFRTLSTAYGVYLTMSLLAALRGLGLHRRPRLLYLAAIPTVLVALTFTQARTLIIAVPIALVVYTVVLRPSLLRGAPTAIVVLLLAGIILALMAQTAIGTEINDLLPPRVQALLNFSSDPNADWRLNSWSTVLTLAGSNPLIGVGLDRLDLLPGGIAPHNSVLTIYYSAGLTGALAFIAIEAATLSIAIRLMRTEMEPARRSLFAAALAWHIAILAILFFNVVLEGPYMAIFFWLSIALVALSGAIPSEARNTAAAVSDSDLPAPRLESARVRRITGHQGPRA